MDLIYSAQFNTACVVAEDGDTAQEVIDHCWDSGSMREVDGVEYCVQIRPDAGPELWTERSLRRSLEG